MAAEVEPSTPPTSEREHQSPCSDKRSPVEVPILVYHHIRTSIPVGSRADQRLTVTVEAFDRQMQYLQENGYRVIIFANLVACLKHVGELPLKLSLFPLMMDGRTNSYTPCRGLSDITTLQHFLLRQILLTLGASFHGHSCGQSLPKE
jgi:hypothetical protein